MTESTTTVAEPTSSDVIGTSVVVTTIERSAPPGTGTPGPHPVRRHHSFWKLLAMAAAGVLVAAHLLLLAPMVERPEHAKPVRIGAHLAYPLNVDSRLFMRTAHSPGLMLTPQHKRQSRPGYVLLLAGSTKVIDHLFSVLDVDRFYGQRNRAYVAGIVINYLAAAFAVALLAYLLLSLRVSWPVILALCAALTVNDVTKAFFWSPHQQIFILLVPVLTIFLTWRALTGATSWRRCCALGLVLGLSALVYANVIVTVAALGIALLLRGLRERTGGERIWLPLGRVLGKGLLLGVAFAVPSLIWIQVCRTVAGSYYSHETAAYHQFVWLPEAAADGWETLAGKVSRNTSRAADMILEATGPMIAVLAALAVCALLAGTPLARPNRQESRLAAATVITIVCTMVFCWGIGYYRTRLGYHLVPPVLVLIAWTAMRMCVRSPFMARYVTVLLPALALLWVGHELTKHGPYA